MKTYIVDSFTDTAFKGNPAGVCILEENSAASESYMQAIAKELNLSETAFIKQLSPHRFLIRYFSPKMEIPLCGHATLAASDIGFEITGSSQLIFETAKGVELKVARKGDFTAMIFPVYETIPATVSANMLSALGLNSVVNCEYNQETNILILEVENTATVKKLAPDFEALVKSHDTIYGVLVTAEDNQTGYDYCCRFFWPWSGTNEDPVTGGIQTFLAKYWQRRLGKSIFKSYQYSEREGFMEVELTENNSVLIRGKAVRVLQGNTIAKID